MLAFFTGCFHRHPSSAPESPVVTVLCYHTFDSPKITPFTVTTRAFREQLRYLHVQHIPVIPLADLTRYLHDGTPVPDHSVVITIDDGYKTALTKAFPLLHEFHFPFTLFIYPQFIGHPSALSWEDLRELSEQGVDMESHSLTHPLLTNPQVVMNRKDYLAWVDKELREPQKILEARLGKPVTAIAYPFGGYSEVILEHTRQAGYAAGLTCDDGNVDRLSDPWRINRRLVYRSVRPKEFADYFRDEVMHVADQSPRDGQYLKTVVSEIRARIIDREHIQPGSVKIFVDKLGHHSQPVAIDPHTGEVRLQLPPNPKTGYYFVSLFAKDRTTPAIWREASWIFIVSRNASKN